MLELTLKVVIPNKKGLHARAAARIVSLSNEFSCQITIRHKDRKVSSLSLIKLLTLDAPQGSELSISACGENSEVAAKLIERLVLSGFDELD